MDIIPNCFYRTSVKALILDNQKRFLLVKEDNGLRELPGGGLDFGENPQECIKRELLEEMGIHIKLVSDVPVYFVTSKNLSDLNISNIIYRVQIDIDDIHKFKPSQECQEIRFFNIQEAAKEQLFPNVIEFLKQYNPLKH
ncbi:MAG: NUDIX hydrolase [Candidatus Absconditicoccaceae bacterium]